MSIISRIHKLYLHDGIPYKNVKEQTTFIYNVYGSYKIEQKNPDMKEYVLNKSIYIKFKKSTNIIYNGRS